MYHQFLLINFDQNLLVHKVLNVLNKHYHHNKNPIQFFHKKMTIHEVIMMKFFVVIHHIHLLIDQFLYEYHKMMKLKNKIHHHHHLNYFHHFHLLLLMNDNVDYLL